jgi:hypothetical protein
MQLSISQSDRFKEDYNRYKSAIEKIEATDKKHELMKLLNQLVEAVNSVDKFYLNLTEGSGLQNQTGDYRSSIISIRKELNRRLGFSS